MTDDRNFSRPKRPGPSASVFKLSDYPVALGLGATAKAQDRYSGQAAWYDRLHAHAKSDGLEGRLVTMHQFTDSWDFWEVHPHGHELVVCVAGRLTVVQRFHGENERYSLTVGEAIINPPGIWHTADVESAATLLYITPGIGTEQRKRRRSSSRDRDHDRDRGSSRSSSDRDRDRDRGSSRSSSDRDHDRDRDRGSSRSSSDRDRDRDRGSSRSSSDRDRDRDRGSSRSSDRGGDRSRDRDSDRSRSRDRDRNRDRFDEFDDFDLDMDRDWDRDRH